METFVYCCISRQSVVLVDYWNASVTDQFSISLNVGNMINNFGRQNSVEKTVQGLTYQIMSSKEFGFCIVAKESFDKTRLVNFLDELRQNLFADLKVVRQAETCSANGLQLTYGETLKTLVQKWFSNSGQLQRVDELRDQVREVREIMTENVERVLARGDRLEDLLDKTEDLESSSSQFRNHAQRVQRKMCCKNAKWNIICSLIVVIVITLIIIVILYEANVFSPSPTTTTPKPSQ